MADLTSLQATEASRIVGSDPSGNETNPVAASVNGDLSVSDGISSGGLQGQLTLVTANTAYELKVGSSRLANRKLVTALPNTATIYWGYTSAVTTTTGTPIFKSQFMPWDLDPTDLNVTIYLVCANALATVQVTESP